MTFNLHRFPGIAPRDHSTASIVAERGHTPYRCRYRYEREKRPLDDALGWINYQQPKRVIVIVATANDSAIEFYRRVGFESRALKKEIVAPHDD